MDEKILQHMIDSEAEFIMEVTDKTKADIKVSSTCVQEHESDSHANANREEP